MQFSITREALLKPLLLVAGTVERRQTIPILSNVLLVNHQATTPHSSPVQRLRENCSAARCAQLGLARLAGLQFGTSREMISRIFIPAFRRSQPRSQEMPFDREPMT